MKRLYNTKEVSELIGIQQQSVSVMCKKYAIGMMLGDRRFLTKKDIDILKKTDGRRK